MMCPQSQSIVESSNDSRTLDHVWDVQVFAMSGAAAQEFVANLLSAVDGLALETTDDGARNFLIVESSGDSQARSVYKLVMSTDAGAVLLHTVHGPESPHVLTAA
jgi:hypothetical protein